MAHPIDGSNEGRRLSSLCQSGSRHSHAIDIASGIKPVPNGRIYIDLANAPFLKSGASGPEFGVGFNFAAERGWLELYESAPYVRTKGSQVLPSP